MAKNQGSVVRIKWPKIKGLDMPSEKSGNKLLVRDQKNGKINVQG